MCPEIKVTPLVLFHENDQSKNQNYEQQKMTVLEIREREREELIT